MSDEDDFYNALAFSRVREAVDRARAKAPASPESVEFVTGIFDTAVDNLPLDVGGWTREAWLLAVILVSLDPERTELKVITDLMTIGVILDEGLTT